MTKDVSRLATATDAAAAYAAATNALAAAASSAGQWAGMAFPGTFAAKGHSLRDTLGLEDIHLFDLFPSYPSFFALYTAVSCR